MTEIYIAVCGAMSLIAFLLYGIDKYKAQKDGWRLPELSLLTLAALGGGLGALLGMLLFRHKINIRRKAHFVLVVPVCVALQALLLWILWTGKAVWP